MTSAPRAMDPELKKAFTELQEKMVDTSQKLKFSDIQIESLKRSKQRAELTIKEMATLEPSTRTYESVGRMFLLDDIKSIKADLETRIKTADEKIKTLDNNKSYLQRNLKESEDNLREMVQQRQGRATTSG
ncbi:prefoldin subunit 1 [Venturia canescens]|uniref:prefoldin subunit 1 n=1 Tax=Venturia canescens TaxID=32260 RepID=UPI001C9CF31F|nr:prefoldin subunit 1 [Venturia canescens]